MFTASLLLLDVMTKATNTSEQRLMIDLRVVNEFYINTEPHQI